MNETVLKRKELSRSTKLKVVNVTMIPTLLYGCETWCLSKHLESRVQATQMNVLRWTEGVSRKDRVRNVASGRSYIKGAYIGELHYELMKMLWQHLISGSTGRPGEGLIQVSQTFEQTTTQHIFEHQESGKIGLSY